MRARVPLIAASIFLLVAVISDNLIGDAADRSGIIAQAVDIVSPETYLAKLGLIRHHRGRTVAVIGDSQIVGETMSQRGDQSWRDHTLDRNIQRQLNLDPSLRDVLVVNLGINGLLPCDLRYVVHDALDAGASALVFNVGMRGFSSDFETAGTMSVRPWLARLCRKHGEVQLCDETSRLLNKSRLYEITDLLQQRFLGGPLRDAIVTATDAAFDRWLRPAADSEDVENSLTLMIRARSRFDSVSFNSDRLQVEALYQTLEEIQARNAKSVVFYTTENNQEFDQIMDHDRAARIRSRILSFLARYASPILKVVPPLETIPPEHFLDFMHLDAQGYHIVAQRIAPLVSVLLKKASVSGRTNSL